MSDNVQLSVRSELAKVISELEKIKEKASEVGDSLAAEGRVIGDSLNTQTKRTETFLGKLRSLSGRVADQMRGDFRSLLSINALGDSLKLSNQFRGAVSESITLGDTIRKLGTSFGIAKGNFAAFQTSLTKGLGEIGLSSETAAKTLEGLVGTNVRGEANVLGYAKTAGQLASISGQKGQEGDIASGMARTIRARGGDANDLGQMKAVAEDLRKIFNSTGKGPTETLRVMEDLFSKMPQDIRKSFGSKGVASLAAAANVAGPNATKFLEDYLQSSPIMRKAFEAQGGKGIIGKEGIDIEKFRSFSKGIMGRVGGDPRLAAQTLGLSEEAAEGFIRLSESLDRVKEAQERLKTSTGNIDDQYQESMGLGESFRANINRVKKVIAEPFSKGQQGLTDLLSKASKSDIGSAAVVGGGGLLAALLAGGALRGIGKGMGGGLGGILGGAAGGALAKQAGATPVWVVNASEMGGAGGAMGALGGMLPKGMGGMLGKAGMFGAAAIATGLATDVVVNKLIPQYTQGTTKEGFEGDAIERLVFGIQRLFNTKDYQYMAEAQKVKIELNERQLKASKQPTRGASF